MSILSSFFPSFLSLATLVMQVILFLIALLLGVAYLTYAERRVMGAIQLRRGPNHVGPLGLLQPFADAIKLMHKETILPDQGDKILFLLAPVVTFTLSLAAWAVIPFNFDSVFAHINVGVLYLFAVSSLSVYGIIIAGWASGSRYALLGALRSAAGMISYEVSIGLSLVSILLLSGSLNLTHIVEAQRQGWFVWPLFPVFIIYFVSALAETNRTPFDLPEAEAELVAGYNVEYSSLSFALFFLGEYANMILQSAMISLLFLGGWLPIGGESGEFGSPHLLWFIGKIAFCLFIFLWIRATLPRYRYDQLMRLGWKIFLPFSLIWMIGTAGVVVMTSSPATPPSPGRTIPSFTGDLE